MPSIGEWICISSALARAVGNDLKSELSRAVSLNLQDANACLRGFSLQVEGLAKLFDGRFGLVGSLLRLFGVDARVDLELFHLQEGFAQGVLSLLELGLVFCPGRIFFGPFLEHLTGELAVVRLLVNEIPHLRLAVKFNQQVAALDVAPGGRQLCDRQGSGLLAGENRSQDGTGEHGFGGAFESQTLFPVSAGDGNFCNALVRKGSFPQSLK